jgi:ATP phosphoribosyltransferase regulatory subunit HisZ
LRADGVVGPITAKALGFTQYTSLQRMAVGAAQLASVITGSLARLVPAPNAEPDLAYSALVALAVQADVMRRALGVLGTIPGTAGAVRELDQIAAGLQQKLASAQVQRFAANTVQQVQAYADSMHGRLLALSRQLQALAKPQQARPGTPDSSVLKLFVLQAKLLAMHAQIMGSPKAVQSQSDAADEVLKIAAACCRASNSSERSR